MSAPVREGEILAGKYRVEKVLGIGGMGVVVAATHIQLEQKVALKFLLPEAAENAEVVSRFGREARAAARIVGEHVARVSDVGELENGLPYMVMEYLEGEDLSQTLDKRKCLPIVDAVEYVLQSCEAIAQAHSVGIVHRDLKPANLFLTTSPDGSPLIKVLDFGISKASLTSSTQDDMSLTKTSSIMGTPLYMSPEQMRSTRQADSRTDIWALGVILFELIAGDTPFAAGSMPELCSKILTEPTPSLRASCPGTPEGLDLVIQRCLQKKPADRFANVGEFALALAPFGTGRSRRLAQQADRIVQGKTGTLAFPADSVQPAPQHGKAQRTASSWSPNDTKGGGRDPRRAALKGWILGGVLAVSFAGGSVWVVKSRAGNVVATAESPPHVPALVLPANIDERSETRLEGNPSVGHVPPGPSIAAPQVSPPPATINADVQPQAQPKGATGSARRPASVKAPPSKHDEVPVSAAHDPPPRGATPITPPARRNPLQNLDQLK